MSSQSRNHDSSWSRPPVSDEPTNLSLIDRVRVRDQAAWQQFATIYDPLVRYWCRRARISEGDLDDVTQDIFTSVYRSIHRFQKTRRTDTFRGWLRSITQKRVADFIKAAVERDPTIDAQRLQHLPDGRHHASDADDVTDPESIRASREMLRRAIETVSESVEQRTWQAFWRTAVDQVPGPSVAEELGMSPDAVRQAKSRMIMRLRLILGSLLTEIARDAGIDLAP